MCSKAWPEVWGGFFFVDTESRAVSRVRIEISGSSKELNRRTKAQRSEASISHSGPEPPLLRSALKVRIISNGSGSLHGGSHFQPTLGWQRVFLNCLSNKGQLWAPKRELGHDRKVCWDNTESTQCM